MIEGRTQAVATTWRSLREHVLTDEELGEERRLAALDAELGELAQARYGLERPGGEGRLTFRRRVRDSVIRRFRLRAAARFLRRASRRVGRTCWAVAQHLPDAARSDLVLVAAEPHDAERGARLLASTEQPYLALVRRGGRLARGAVQRIEHAVRRDPEAVLVYGRTRSTRGVPIFAPAFSRLRLREEDYLGPVVVVSTRWLREAGGFHPSADGAHVLDLALRADPRTVRRSTSVFGVGAQSDRPTGALAEQAVRVVVADLARAGVAAAVEQSAGIRSVEYAPDPDAFVSIIIPTRGGAGTVGGSERVFVVEAVRGLVQKTTWPRYEIIVVADDATPQPVVDELEAIAADRLRLVRWSAPFDFSAKMNRGAVVARGSHLLVLNDDVELLSPDWLERLLGLVAQPEVGIVGAMLFFEDGSIQHLGHVYDGGAPGHVAFGVTPGAATDAVGLKVIRRVSGVTAACAMLSTPLFREIGGFSSVFPGNYNDVDLCRKIVDRGLEAVCSGRVRLYHFESRTRDATVLPAEFESLQRRWGRSLLVDPFADTRG